MVVSGSHVRFIKVSTSPPGASFREQRQPNGADVRAAMDVDCFAGTPGVRAFLIAKNEFALRSTSVDQPVHFTDRKNSVIIFSKDC